MDHSNPAHSPGGVRQNTLASGGFTLIELLVVLAIGSLISSIVFTSVSTARRKARDTRRFLDLREMGKALRLYGLDTDSLPFASKLVKQPPWIPAEPPDPSNPVTVYAAAAYSNDYTFHNYVSPPPWVYPWNDLAQELLPYISPLSVDPINDTASTDHMYYYYAAFDANNRPLTLYWRPDECPSQVRCYFFAQPPGIPFSAALHIYLEQPIGNGRQIYRAWNNPEQDYLQVEFYP